VGSEMCIRDSIDTCPSYPYTGAAGAATAPATTADRPAATAAY